jgi:hypothetical protein
MPPMHMGLDGVSNSPISDMSHANRGLHSFQNVSLRNSGISCLARDFPRVILGERLRNNRSHVQVPLSGRRGSAATGESP